MDILVKVSGSLIEDKRFYDWLSAICSSFNKLFILCGGGESITRALEEKKISYGFGPHGREIYSLEGKRLAQQILKKERSLIGRRLKEKGIDATVFVPVIVIENKILHMNADDYAITLYPNFDKIYIVTLKGRAKSFPKDLNKIEVVYL